jgi:hypothetical protein
MQVCDHLSGQIIEQVGMFIIGNVVEVDQPAYDVVLVRREENAPRMDESRRSLVLDQPGQLEDRQVIEDSLDGEFTLGLDVEERPVWFLPDSS